MKPFLSLVVCLVSLSAQAPAQEKLPKFREQVIDKDVGDIWAMTLADINADGKMDVVVLTWAKPARLVWYENPTWKRRVIVENTPDMLVAVEPLDVDGDGKTELILGAGYHEPLDATRGGTIWLLQRPDDLEKPWTPIQIGAEPVLHRIHAVDLEGKGKKDVVCSALIGREKKGAALFALRRPADPFKDPWVREPISDELHSVHNTWSVDWDGDGRQEVLAASREGITLWKRSGEGKWTKRPIGAGHPGSSEVAVGRLPGGKRYIAAMEPHHGWEAVIYTEPAEPGGLWKRKVVMENKGGHTVWPADVTGTGADSMLMGFVGAYSNKPGGPAIYLFHPLDAQGENWEKLLIDDKDITGEDGACADLNGDGRIDVIATGGKHVKIYWNEGR